MTAQNVGWDDTHGLAGKTSASDLSDSGCRYVFAGHSERRVHLGETNDLIARKLRTAVTHQLTPILCIGDALEHHQAQRSDDALRAQLEALTRVARRTMGPFLIAYEPTWATSTRNKPRDCTPEEAGDRHSFIRSVIAAELGTTVAAETRLLFGGSVSANKAALPALVLTVAWLATAQQ